MNEESFDAEILLEKLVESGDLEGDRWINDEYCEETEYFDPDPDSVEDAGDGQYIARFSLAKTFWYHEAGGMDVHIGIDSYAHPTDGESTEIDEGYLNVWFKVDGDGEYYDVHGEIEMVGCPDPEGISHIEPSEFHETPYKIV